MKKLTVIFTLTILAGSLTSLAGKPTEANVSYGPHPRNKMNFWKCESEEPVGVKLIIHGGGWHQGGKPGQVPDKSLKCHHVCAIDYPLMKGKHAARQPEIVQSAARAVQFLRHKAKEWNIDTDRIVATGISAGAALSLWLAFHDDMADPDNEDPVLRESTRIAGAHGGWGQTTLDAQLLKERIGMMTVKHVMVWQSVGAESPEELMENWDKYKELSLECSALTHVTKDDPPVYVEYTGGDPVPPTNMGNAIHNDTFGTILKEKCDEVGTTCYLSLKKKKEFTPPMSPAAFMNNILCPKEAK
jgi:hypothetical protein